MKKCIVIPLLLVCFMLFGNIKIGVLLPLTGEVSGFGKAMKMGIDLAHEERGTVLGEKIDLVYYDSKSERIGAQEGAEKLIIQEGVTAIIGEVISSNTIAAGEVAEKRKIPLVAPVATNPLVTKGKKFVSRVCFTDPFQGKALAEFVSKTLKVKRVAIFTETGDEYSTELTDYFMSRFKTYSEQVVQLSYKAGDRDFTQQISKAISHGSEAFVITGYYEEIALIAKQSRSMGYKGYILAGDGADAPELIQMGGQAVEGLYFTAHYHPDAPVTQNSKKFLQAFIGKYGTKPPSSDAPLGYDTYMILVEAIDRAKTKNPEKIATAVRSIKDFQGVTGMITIDASGDPIKDVVIEMIKNQQFSFAAVISANLLK